MKKNVFSGVPVCHDFKGGPKGGGGGGIVPPTFEGKIETIVGVCSSNSLATR